jgi:hypothetical protein
VAVAEDQCSALGEMCWTSQCCRDPGIQCYEKNPGYAICRPRCTPGVDTSEPAVLRVPWSCNVVTPWSVPVPASAPPPETSPGTVWKPCSSEGENCVFSRCCVDP